MNDANLLRRTVGSKRSIMIDEIQRHPSLLNTIQALIDEDPRRRFFLTASSVRKLSRGRANLLPGRVHTYELGPLTALELGKRFDVQRALSRGLLPEPYLDTDSKSWSKTLRAYAATYLREEIQAEALTRNLEGFSRFLNVAIAWSGDLLDFSKMASLAEIDRTSAKRYFEILEDTLVVNRLDAFTKNEKLRLIRHPKFYVSDVGVLNASLGNFRASPDRIGRLFEHLVVQLVRSTAQALDKDVRLSLFRTANGAEVDLILEEGSDLTAIEIKAAKRVTEADFRGLAVFRKFMGDRPHRRLVVSLDPLEQDFENGRAIPLEALWRSLSWT